MTEKKDMLMKEKSSEKLYNFLEKTNLHKKDFAQMIGVTLSYVYNLIDETIPFSSRSTTLERIAAVMDTNPEEFSEYKIPQDPVLFDEASEFIREKIKEKKLSAVQFLKAFPRRQRLEMVDILRGARPIPLDWEELKVIAQVLDISKGEMYTFWEKRLKQVLSGAGFNLENNQKLADAMFECAQKHIKNSAKL